MAISAGVPAVHVIAGVLGLGVAQLLGDPQRIVKAQVLLHHLGEHKVGGAVDDALDLADNVGCQALVHGGNDGGAAAHGCLKQEGTVVGLGQTQQLGTVGGHHLLVGGAHAAAALQAGLNVWVSKTGAADGLHYHPDLRVLQDGVDALDEQVCSRVTRKILRVQDILDLHRLPGAARHARSVAAQHLVHAAAHRAKAQNCNFSHNVFPLPFLTDCTRSARPPPCAGGRAFL